MKTRSLFLIRHAHRETFDYQTDNGLSEKGLAQAERLKAYFLPIIGEINQFELLSSPRLRCIQTLNPVGQSLETSVRVNPLLEEKRAGENHSEFSERIQKFFNEWENSECDCSLACSHGDWIPTALDKIFDVDTHIKKAGFVEITYKDFQYQLASITQKLEDQ